MTKSMTVQEWVSRTRQGESFGLNVSQVSALATHFRARSSMYERPSIVLRTRQPWFQEAEPGEAVDRCLAQVDEALGAFPGLSVILQLPAGTDPRGHQSPNQMRFLDPLKVGGLHAALWQRHPHTPLGLWAGFWLDEDPSTLLHDFVGGSFDDVDYRDEVTAQYTGSGMFDVLMLDALAWAPESDWERWRLHIQETHRVEVIGEAPAVSVPEYGENAYRKVKSLGVKVGCRYGLVMDYPDALPLVEDALDRAQTPLIAHCPDLMECLGVSEFHAKYGVHPDLPFDDVLLSAAGVRL